MCLVPDPRSETSIKVFRVRNDPVDETSDINGRVWILRDTEGPQEKSRVNEDGSVGNVLAGAKPTQATSLVGTAVNPDLK